MPAGYSATPLVRKLGFKPGMRVVYVNDPAHYVGLLGALPDDVKLLMRAGENMDLIHVFCTRVAELERRLASLEPRLADGGSLWISWPKKTSALASELTGDSVRELGLAAGLVDVKVCAVDGDWSGLKFVRRVSDRKKK
ncbi:MAG: hypothetical protein ACI8QZ_001513 [Chlamydiales bacterium]|jgi:hypothetical protein